MLCEILSTPSPIKPYRKPPTANNLEDEISPKILNFDNANEIKKTEVAVQVDDTKVPAVQEDVQKVENGARAIPAAAKEAEE